MAHEVITEETLLERSNKIEERKKILNEREKQVSNLEKLKRDLESEYNIKMSLLDAKEADVLKEKTKELTKLKSDLEIVNAKLEETKKNLIKKEEELIEAKLSFEPKLTQYKESRLQDVEQKLLSKINEEIKKIEKNYQEFFNSTVDIVNWSNDKLKKAFDNLNEEFKLMLQAKEGLVNQRKRDLEEAIVKYEEAIAKSDNIEKVTADLNIRERKLDRKEKMIDGLVDGEVKKRYVELLNENQRLQGSLDLYIEKCRELASNYEKIRSQYTSDENFDVIKMKNEKDRLLNQLEKYQKLYKEYTTEEFEELKRRAAQYESVNSSNAVLRLKTIELENQVELLKNESFQNDTLKFQNEKLKATIKAERLMLVQLQTEIDNLSSRIENKKSGIIAAEAIETPINDFVALPKGSKADIKENDWLQNIMNSCKEAGFSFSKRLYYSFHTSLKTSDMSPLTVLAGVSGTGKSKLPQLYSKFGGIYFLSVPVKPDWDSPQSLFGYFNSIEKRFDATTLLRAIVMFQKDKSKSPTKEKIDDLSDRVLIVLLDEMNLAHIEQYFSDLLSKLEERRGEMKDVSFEVDLGAGNEKYSVILTDNVKWVGTMNEDETTKSLSDKVIDRGNVISFPRPKHFERYKNSKESKSSTEMIQRNVWEKWVKNKVELTELEVKKYMDIVIGINDVLKSVNRALGHRVWQSIENYMMSHPLVVENQKAEPERREIALTYAFEEALVHKVMPKLRGISTDGIQKDECLDIIDKLLSNNGFSIVKDFEHAMGSVTGTFIWDSANYLDDEYEKLD